MEDKTRIVLTGGGGTGKSTIIDELISRGFCAHKEVAREVIRESLEIGSDALPWDNIVAFSLKVQEKMLLDYHNKENKSICFFDRCLLDVKAYLELDDFPIYAELDEVIENHPYYKNVFVLPPWREIFENDEERIEDFEESVRAFNQIKQTYISHGYTIIEVPVGTNSQRVDFIVDYIKLVQE